LIAHLKPEGGIKLQKLRFAKYDLFTGHLAATVEIDVAQFAIDAPAMWFKYAIYNQNTFLWLCCNILEQTTFAFASLINSDRDGQRTSSVSPTEVEKLKLEEPPTFLIAGAATGKPREIILVSSENSPAVTTVTWYTAALLAQPNEH
jgi:hypothetical protein